MQHFKFWNNLRYLNQSLQIKKESSLGTGRFINYKLTVLMTYLSGILNGKI